MKTLVSLALLAIISGPLAAISVANHPPKTHTEYITVQGGVRLHVTDLGEGKPIVFIHGWPLSNAMYEYQYQNLIKEGFRVIGITLRGFGQSDKPGGAYTYDVYADDIKSVLDQLHVEGATLAGFSMGGAISIHYVARHKAAHVTKLALFGAAAPVWTQRADYPYGFTKEAVNGLIDLSYRDRPQLLADFGQIFAARPEALNAGMGNWLNGIGLQASPYATTQSLIALRDTDLRSELAKIQLPTAIFHGKLDKICSFELALQMQKGIKNAQLIPFEKSGHGLFVEELEKFNAELIKFAR